MVASRMVALRLHGSAYAGMAVPFEFRCAFLMVKVSPSFYYLLNTIYRQKRTLCVPSALCG